jgi:hypothetical protein
VWKGQLHASHPLTDSSRSNDQFANELDPLELIVRAMSIGAAPMAWLRAGCLRPDPIPSLCSASSILELRLWDDGNRQAGDRLGDVQRPFDWLNDPALCTAFVRDARC